jgi:exopolyphosphatase/guanosine-5'-triphosphate,3'-diphosphate pyrophosphatase
MRRAAVIDIGSNSVRLVVYGIEGAALISLFDEKAMCGLGRGLMESGKLHPDGARAAIDELRRFARVAADEEPEALSPFATSAVRDASDGPAFLDAVFDATGLKVEVLSGLEEARLAAAGVAGAVPQATGLVGDLGGGSLELVRLENGKALEQATLPIGALRHPAGTSPAETSAWIDGALASVPWLGQCSGQPFYLVGGAWRSFARAHMLQNNYPLPVIHQYTMTTDGAYEMASLFSAMSEQSASLLESVSKRRRAIMPYAATMLGRVLAQSNADSVVASSHGLREGYVHDRFGNTEGDPLLDYCRFTGASTARIAPEGETIFKWLLPLFPDLPPHLVRLVLATSWLADVAGREHPDRRAYIGYSRALNLPGVALDHAGRGFLAAAVRCRYSGSPRNGVLDEARQLTPPDEIETAIRLGVVLRLGQAISPTGRSLAETRIGASGDCMVLTGPEALLAGETIGRRLAAAAEAFGCKPQLQATS